MSDSLSLLKSSRLSENKIYRTVQYHNVSLKYKRFPKSAHIQAFVWRVEADHCKTQQVTVTQTVE